MTKSKYKQDGVDIDVGDVFSKFCGELCKGTYQNSPFVVVNDLSRGNFRGPRGYKFVSLPEGFISTGAMDGIGTKVVIIDAARNHQSAASNLIAMTAMDITRYGGLPLLFLNILDVRTLGKLGSETYKACCEIMRGLSKIARFYNYVLLTGETAELGLCVGSENPDATVMFNWGGAMLGAYHPDKMILGDMLAPGQIIMALQDDFRSNGISTARKALAMEYGPEWWKNESAAEDILSAALPSLQYDRFLNTLHGWFNQPTCRPLIKMHLIVHLSGGAFKSKLGEDMLKPLGLSADLNNLFEPPKIMKKCAQWRGMSEEECYTTWNGGQGAIVVIDEADEKAFIEGAKNYGIPAQKAGMITEQCDYTVAIKSKFGNEVIKY
jgi:phosphoribosylaminoimidazole (AIR) synthetase